MATTLIRFKHPLMVVCQSYKARLCQKPICSKNVVLYCKPTCFSRGYLTRYKMLKKNIFSLTIFNIFYLECSKKCATFVVCEEGYFNKNKSNLFVWVALILFIYIILCYSLKLFSRSSSIVSSLSKSKMFGAYELVICLFLLV